MRNKVAHEGSDGGRSGGWTIFEHLVMAAYVFPLAVKLLLEREGHYVLTDTDRGWCWAVDLKPGAHFGALDVLFGEFHRPSFCENFQMAECFARWTEYRLLFRPKCHWWTGKQRF